GGSGWEWYVFSPIKGDILEGFVHGFEDEWGSFSQSELKEAGVKLHTDPEELAQVAPPVGWKEAEPEKPKKPKAKVTPQVPAIEGVTPLGQPPAEEKPKPKVVEGIKPESLLDEQAKKDLDDALGGLMASVPTYRLTKTLAASEPDFGLEQKDIPPEKLPAFIKAAQSMIRSGVDTPEKLAREIPEKARPYLQAIWDAMGM